MVQIRQLVVLDHVPWIQVLQRVGPDQDRTVRVLFAEVRVVQILIKEDLNDPQEQTRIRRGPDGNPVVGLRRGRAVLRHDDHDTAAALHALDEPVGFGHLVLDEVLAPAHMQLREDRKSTRLNSSHLVISYAVFCLKKKKTTKKML